LDERRDSFLNVAGSGAELGIALRLKAQIELTHVVDGGENGKARPVGVLKLSTCQPGEASVPDREQQQSLGHGGDVCTVIEEWVPLMVTGLTSLATQFSPERRWPTVHGCPRNVV
jgi:hypothetical protein